MDKAITVDIESSSREEDVSITSNLSSIDSFYTMVQDQLRNSYQIGYDGSLRIIYASGLDSHYQTEPHVLAGTANPTVAKRNMSLPGENGQNLVEWRFRKEQAQGKVNVFGRKLRVSQCQRVGDGRPAVRVPEGGPSAHPLLILICPEPNAGRRLPCQHEV
ncbi:teneurin-3-like [Leptonychotes weddellii]|uniref:Teneurin-3-like n=1 Tax=Leptonychotes weddellii TaxID=9713 RepID=A0A2U3Z6B3_LEPWE|nr:teneurin-3-like [Leptonychotes weddellii]